MSETASIVADLESAKALIADPTKWTKHYFRTDDGCHCAAGAVFAVTGGIIGRSGAAIDALINALGHNVIRSLTRFNDAGNTTHADIMALFDRAISLAKTGATP